MIKIAFFGTPDFALAALCFLHEKSHDNNFQIALVITAVDKPSGRGQKLSRSPIKEYALANNLPLIQPNNLKSPKFLEEFASYQIDLNIVVAFRMMPKLLWDMPRYKTINLHASLLPNYRGAAPINWAIIKGEKITGLTTFLIDEAIDEGNILLQEKIVIEDSDNFESLYHKMKIQGADLLLRTISGFIDQSLKPQPQNPDLAIHLAPKITKDILAITSFDDAKVIHNFVRGLAPIYSPYILFQGKKIILKQTSIIDDKSNVSNIGNIVSDNKSYAHLICHKGILSLDLLQLEGKKTLSIKEFLNGNSF
ncbi:MAG: methionyl-tRNA formyltransferase [Chitinophagales bacterium]|jgi:methionyl-tRNA formyltransferase|nr:methionyl-tRNA formyltransferase [Chitinophagales bacterium]